jgi:hypothetical protein
MSGMILPILDIPVSQLLIMDHKKVLSITLLGGLGEIERPCDHRLPVNDHHLVMRNGVLGVYLNGYPIMYQDKRGACAATLLRTNLFSCGDAESPFKVAVAKWAHDDVLLTPPLFFNPLA